MYAIPDFHRSYLEMHRSLLLIFASMLIYDKPIVGKFTVILKPGTIMVDVKMQNMLFRNEN